MPFPIVVVVAITHNIDLFVDTFLDDPHHGRRCRLLPCWDHHVVVVELQTVPNVAVVVVADDPHQY